MEYEDRPGTAMAASTTFVARAPEWKTIDSAPRDGTRILLFDPKVWDAEMNDYTGGYKAQIEVGYYEHGFPHGYYSGCYPLMTPTHWMPLPIPPKE